MNRVGFGIDWLTARVNGEMACLDVLSWVGSGVSWVSNCWGMGVAATDVGLRAGWMAVAMAVFEAAEGWLGADELGRMEVWPGNWLLGSEGSCGQRLLER